MSNYVGAEEDIWNDSSLDLTELLDRDMEDVQIDRLSSNLSTLLVGQRNLLLDSNYSEHSGLTNYFHSSFI